MAKRKPIVIDGEIREIPSSAKTISDIETIKIGRASCRERVSSPV